MRFVRAKVYYTIGEVSRITNIPENTIRYWESKGLVVPSRKQGRRRLYTKQDIRKLLEVKYSRKRINRMLVEEIRNQIHEMLEEIRKVLK